MKVAHKKNNRATSWSILFFLLCTHKQTHRDTQKKMQHLNVTYDFKNNNNNNNTTDTKMKRAFMFLDTVFISVAVSMLWQLWAVMIFENPIVDYAQNTIPVLSEGTCKLPQCEFVLPTEIKDMLHPVHNFMFRFVEMVRCDLGFYASVVICLIMFIMVTTLTIKFSIAVINTWQNDEHHTLVHGLKLSVLPFRCHTYCDLRYPCMFCIVMVYIALTYTFYFIGRLTPEESVCPRACFFMLIRYTGRSTRTSILLFMWIVLCGLVHRELCKPQSLIAHFGRIMSKVEPRDIVSNTTANKTTTQHYKKNC